MACAPCCASKDEDDSTLDGPTRIYDDYPTDKCPTDTEVPQKHEELEFAQKQEELNITPPSDSVGAPKGPITDEASELPADHEEADKKAAEEAAKAAAEKEAEEKIVAEEKAKKAAQEAAAKKAAEKAAAKKAVEKAAREKSAAERAAKDKTGAKKASKVTAPLDKDSNTFTVTISMKPTDIIGVEVDLNVMGCLRIVKVKAGIFEKWNTDNPSQCVTKGCDITEINGTSGDPPTLLAQMKKSPTLVMQVTRGPK